MKNIIYICTRDLTKTEIMAHTKGRWYIENENSVNQYGVEGIDISSDHGHINIITVWCPDKTIEESYADAKLIAAAPELLKFAQAFSKSLANGEFDIKAKEGFYKEIAEMVGLNISAIKKATEQL